MSAATGAEVTMRDGARGSALGEFERIYRANVGAVASYFARRCTDPQTVADLTSETIVRAAAGFGGFDRGRGAARGWLLGIAGHVYAQYCAHTSIGRDAAARLAGLAELPADEIDELTDRIDAERAARALFERCAELSALERAAVELVDRDGLTPKEAAAALGVPRGVLRVRLSRARARLRKEHHSDA
jgi:RNA polymerase sigma-70 factor (ECF subfamily)